MNSPEDRSIFTRIWTGFWRFIDGARRITLNLLFLIFLVILFQLITSTGEEADIKPDSTLILQPIGVVVEQYSGYPVDRVIADWTGEESRETQLRDILDTLARAKDDERIVQLLIETSHLAATGMANLQEIGQAIEDFRSSGKKVIAIGDFFSEDRYYLASLADEIWLDPQGMVWFDGLAYYRNYFREGLDKLAVDVHLFRVGTYKSAIEPFIRDDMSEADRIASQYLIDDLWNNYLSAIALHRGLPTEVLNELTQNYAQKVVEAQGNAAQLALDLGLVDRLMRWPEARSELAQYGASDKETGFRQVTMQDYLAQQRRQPQINQQQVGVIVAEGNITGGDQPPGTIGSESLAKLLRQANRNDNIKAVVLRVNSPGGSALASEIIRSEMELLNDSGKPVVVSMGNVAASGGYWISMGAAEVWANPNTITGSIGIFGVIPTFDRTLAKLGIHTDGVGTTPLSGGLRADRPLDPAAGEMIQSLVERGYKDFLELVSRFRELSVEEVDQVAQGRVWTGGQALERQLVDQSGTLQDAIGAAARRAGLGDDYQVTYVEQELTGFERLLAEAAGGSVKALFGEQVESLTLNHLAQNRQLANEWNSLSAALPVSSISQQAGISSKIAGHPVVTRMANELKVLLSDQSKPQIVAHCFCATP